MGKHCGNYAVVLQNSFVGQRTRIILQFEELGEPAP